MSLSKILTGQKGNEGGFIAVGTELYKKIEDHAKMKGVTVDQEATELINVAIKLIEALMAAKAVMKGGDTEL